MFNSYEVKSTIEHDEYGFTYSLMSYVNSPDSRPPSRDMLDKILHKAYKKNLSEEQRILQNALFIIYQINLTHPLSYAATLQHDELLSSIKSDIEYAWLNNEFRASSKESITHDNESYSTQLIKLWK